MSNFCVCTGVKVTHFQFNSVEFIKTGPCSCLSQALEEFAHSLEVQAV